MMASLCGTVLCEHNQIASVDALSRTTSEGESPISSCHVYNFVCKSRSTKYLNIIF